MESISLTELFNKKIIRIIFAILFFVFLINILYQFGVFLGVNKNILDMYFIWFGLIILFITILPTNRSNI